MLNSWGALLLQNILALFVTPDDCWNSSTRQNGQAKEDKQDISAVKTAESDDEDSGKKQRADDSSAGDRMSRRRWLLVRRMTAVMNKNEQGRAELDSHCDTCSIGKDAVLVYDTGHTVSVEPFDSFNEM